MTRTVRIVVDTLTGDITYFPALLHVQRMDDVSWVFAQGGMTIWFMEASPLQDGGPPRARARAKPKRKAAARGTTLLGTIGTKAPRGRYHYGVALSVGGEVFVDAGCPTVEV